MTLTALARAQAILGGASLEDVASWADDYRRDHPETAPWHYIDIPLADSRIDLAWDCPHNDCIVIKTEQFLAVLKDPQADRTAKADIHQPLHDEDNGDKNGNTW